MVPHPRGADLGLDQKEEDRATLTAILERFERWRHRQVLELKARLEKGEVLTERDNEFLSRVFESARELMPIIERSPEYQKLACLLINVHSRSASHSRYLDDATWRNLDRLF